MSLKLELDVFDPAMRADPYPHYRLLRHEVPVHQTRHGVYVIAKWTDVNAVLRDPRTSSDYGKAEGYDPDPVKDMLRSVLLFADPPDHTRLRKLVNKAFTPRAVSSLTPVVRGHVRDLIAAAAPKGEIDVVGEFAYPLTVRMMCDILGVPRDEREQFMELSRDTEEWWTATREARMASILDPTRTPPEDNEDTQSVVWAFVTYVDGLIKAKRERPGEDLLSILIQADDAGDYLTHEELLFMAILLFVGGRDTTANFTGNAIHALLRHPDAMRALRDDPSLMRTAAEELLRYDAAVQLVLRTVLDDVELRGVTIPARQQVVLLLGSANRDEDQFPEPDTLDLGRVDNQHLAFSSGAHFCVAAPLARVIGQEALTALLPCIASSQPKDEPMWRDLVTMKGLASLPVALTSPSGGGGIGGAVLPPRS